MGELTVGQLIKIILGILVVIAVIFGVYLFFKNNVMDFLSNVGGEESEEIGGEKIGEVEGGEIEKPTGYAIWERAKAYADAGYDHFRIIDGKKEYDNVCASFVTKVLNSVGINLESKGDFIPYMITEFEERDDFIEVDSNELQKGDLVVVKLYYALQGFKNTQHIIIFSHYENNGKTIRAYGDPGIGVTRKWPVQLESWQIKGATKDFYRAFRYVGDDYKKPEKEYWTIDSARKQTDVLIKNYGKEKKYSDNEDIKKFINELCDDEILSNQECSFKIGENEKGFRVRFGWNEKNLEDLRKVLGA